MKIPAMIFILFSTGVILFTSYGKNNSIIGSWEVSGFPDFPFYETYIFRDDKSFTIMRKYENNINIVESEGMYLTSGKKLKMSGDSTDILKKKYTFTIDNDRLTLENSSGDRMIYTKVTNSQS